MFRSTRRLAATAAVFTALGASALAAQSTDTTRAVPRDSSAAGERALRRGAMPRESRRGMMLRQPRRLAPDGPMRERPRRSQAMRGARGTPLLAGITLSTDQERALRATRARRIAELRPLLIEGVSARSDLQIAQLNGDQRALDAATARLRTNREKLAAARDSQSYVRDLRAVLTPDQQQKLDVNLQSMRDRRAAFQRGTRMRERQQGPRMIPRFRDTMPGMRMPRGPRGEESSETLNDSL